MSRPTLVSFRALGIILSVGLMTTSLTLDAARAAVPAPVIRSISTGEEHTCALSTAGGVMCWGRNDRGQLGDGTRTRSLTPVDVLRLTSGVESVSAEGQRTCALTTAGGVKCWGDNEFGYLGDGTTLDRIHPVDVVGLKSGVSAIDAGNQHACALTTAGGVKCWGDNQNGQLGDGTLTLRGIPVDVSGLTSGVAAISAGNHHTCALTTAGGVKCWGDNEVGELGDGTATQSTVPVDVSGLSSGVAAISAGAFHTCALTTAGAVKCWGYVVLGNGSHGARYVPTDISGLTSGVTAISAGWFHTCALMSSGDLRCWGYNTFGELGDGTTTDRIDPVDVRGLMHRTVAMSAGPHHTCAVTTSGGVKCWGWNMAGQLGDGATGNRSVPTDVFGPTISGVESSLSATTPITSGGQVSVTTTWMGADPYASITSYQAQMQVNGATWSDVTLASPTATDLNVSLSPSSRYRFRIRATDALGRASVWFQGTVFTLNAAQEESASYAGAWASDSVAGSWGGAVEYSADLNASASFAFHGRSVGWIGTIGPQYGSADVFVDGAYVTTVDCSAGSVMTRQASFSIGGLEDRNHTLKIVNLATAGHPRIDIDGFVTFR